MNRPMVTIFGDFLSVDQTSEENAIAIRELGLRLPCEGHIDALKLDPAANAKRKWPSSDRRIRTCLGQQDRVDVALASRNRRLRPA